MRRPIVLLLTCAALALGAAPAEAATFKRCGTVPVTDSIEGSVFAKRLGCATARSVFRSWLRQATSPPFNTRTVRGYRCRYTSAMQTLRVSCVRGSRQVVARWGD